MPSVNIFYQLNIQMEESEIDKLMIENEDLKRLVAYLRWKLSFIIEYYGLENQFSSRSLVWHEIVWNFATSYVAICLLSYWSPIWQQIAIRFLKVIFYKFYNYFSLFTSHIISYYSVFEIVCCRMILLDLVVNLLFIWDHIWCEIWDCARLHQSTPTDVIVN